MRKWTEKEMGTRVLVNQRRKEERRERREKEQTAKAKEKGERRTKVIMFRKVVETVGLKKEMQLSIESLDES